MCDACTRLQQQPLPLLQLPWVLRTDGWSNNPCSVGAPPAAAPPGPHLPCGAPPGAGLAAGDTFLRIPCALLHLHPWETPPPGTPPALPAPGSGPCPLPIALPAPDRPWELEQQVGQALSTHAPKANTGGKPQCCPAVGESSAWVAKGWFSCNWELILTWRTAMIKRQAAGGVTGRLVPVFRCRPFPWFTAEQRGAKSKEQLLVV